MSRVVCWFSCGAASAVAAHLACAARPDAEVVYCDTLANEHPDNQRFMDDVSRWLDRPVTVIRSQRFASVDEVITTRRYMAGTQGAPCTVELKKIPRFDFQRPDDIHVFGYTADEQPRVARFTKNNPELNLWWPLIEARYSKQRCLDTLTFAGIELPAMYRLGFKNNNCIGCVKATSLAYWKRVRECFPEVFARRVRQSRELGVRLTRLRGERIFLDEIPDDGLPLEPIVENISCGPECGVTE